MQTSQTLLVAHCWIVCNAQCTVHSLHSCCKRAKLFPADPRPPSQWLPVKTWKLAPIRDNIRPKMQTGCDPGIPTTSDRRFKTGWKLALIPKSWQHLAFWSAVILSHLPVVEIGWTTLWTSVDGTSPNRNGDVLRQQWKKGWWNLQDEKWKFLSQQCRKGGEMSQVWYMLGITSI